MKYSFAAVALAAVASAQTLADIPKCAIPCLDKAITDNTSCKISDLACVCKNFDAVQGDATACVLKECGSDVAINEVLPAASKLCKNPPAAGGETTKAEEPPAQTTSTMAEMPKPEETKPVMTPTMPTPAPMPTVSDIVEPPANKPEPTPVPTAAAAPVSYMGGLAMLVLGALAL